MLKWIAITIVIALAAVLGYAATRPDSFRIERSIRIRAAPDKIFSMVNNLTEFVKWSPYEKVDPAMERHFDGPAAGPGAKYAWNGNRNIGAGRMEIMSSTQASSVVMRLDMSAPIEAHNIVTFKLTPESENTVVSWTMEGPSPFVSKVMGLIFNMDKMIGRQFESGLAELKAQAERPAAA